MHVQIFIRMNFFYVKDVYFIINANVFYRNNIHYFRYIRNTPISPQKFKALCLGFFASDTIFDNAVEIQTNNDAPNLCIQIKSHVFICCMFLYSIRKHIFSNMAIKLKLFLINNITSLGTFSECRIDDRGRCWILSQYLQSFHAAHTLTPTLGIPPCPFPFLCFKKINQSSDDTNIYEDIMTTSQRYVQHSGF